MRISMDTYRQVRGVFDVEPQPPIEVKIMDIKGNTPWLSTLPINGKFKPGSTFREYPPVAGSQFSLKAKI